MPVDSSLRQLGNEHQEWPLSILLKGFMACSRPSSSFTVCPAVWTAARPYSQRSALRRWPRCCFCLSRRSSHPMSVLRPCATDGSLSPSESHPAGRRAGGPTGDRRTDAGRVRCHGGGVCRSSCADSRPPASAFPRHAHAEPGRLCWGLRRERGRADATGFLHNAQRRHPPYALGRHASDGRVYPSSLALAAAEDI